MAILISLYAFCYIAFRHAGGRDKMTDFAMRRKVKYGM